MSDLAPLLLGTLLVGVVWRMCGLAGCAALVLVAGRCCAGLGLVAIVGGRGSGYVCWLGLDGCLGTVRALLALGFGCDAILLLFVHDFVRATAPLDSPPLSFPAPEFISLRLRLRPRLRPRPLDASFFSTKILSPNPDALPGYSMRLIPIGPVCYAAGVEFVAHLSRVCGFLQEGRLIRPQLFRETSFFLRAKRVYVCRQQRGGFGRAQKDCWRFFFFFSFASKSWSHTITRGKE